MKWIQLRTFTLATFVVFSFQNCSFSRLESIDSSSKSAAPIEPHSEVPKSKNLEALKNLVSRRYITHLLIDIFGDTQSNREILNRWIASHPSLYGFPCDKADPIPCATTPTIQMSLSPDVLRSAHKAQACQQLLDNDSNLAHALAKVDANYLMVAPNPSNLEQLLDLFYRGDMHSNELIEGLVLADRVAVHRTTQVSILDRWRIQTLAICDSTGWEIL